MNFLKIVREIEPKRNEREEINEESLKCIALLQCGKHEMLVSDFHHIQ
jgi:hypothetical protein